MEVPVSNLRPVRRGAWAVAVLVLWLDMGVYWFLLREDGNQYAYRLLAAVALAYALVWAGWVPAEAMGFDWSRWRADVLFTLRVGVVVCLVLGSLFVVALAVIRLAGLSVGLPPPEIKSSADFFPWLLHACVMAPVVEEFIYRGLFVGLAQPAWGRRACIAVSGVVFVLLHAVYAGGPLHPVAWVEYLVAGSLLAWAFSVRGSLVAPIALHALGNLTVAVQNLIVLRFPAEVGRLLGN